MKRVCLQLYLLLLGLYQMILSFSVFFCLRAVLLRVFGNHVARRVAFHRGIRLFAFSGMSIGEGSVINRGCYLDSRRGIVIGRNVNLAHDVKIYTLGHDIRSSGFESRGASVVVDDFAVIFAQAAIMPGVRIGSGAVVYPGSVVVKDVMPMQIVGGNPARVLGVRPDVLDYELDYRYWMGH
jgi:acetyltransferase-like isoleucine patch superfamily enzyme